MEFTCNTCIFGGDDLTCHKERIVAPDGDNFKLVYPKVEPKSFCHLGQWAVVMPKCKYDEATKTISDFNFVLKLTNYEEIKGDCLWDHFCEDNRCYFCGGSCVLTDYLVELRIRDKYHLSHFGCLSKNASNFTDLDDFIKVTIEQPTIELKMDNND